MVDIIQDLTLLLLVSLPVNLLFHKVRLPSVLGYLVAGAVIGPHALGLIDDIESVEHLAEIGILLLMFLIGLEFSLSHMLKNVGRVLGAGSLQLGLTSVAVFAVLWSLGQPQSTGWLIGGLAAFSSTALVLKMITDRAEIDTANGRTCIGVLLIQDLMVVPMMLLIPLLGHETQNSGTTILLALIKAAIALVAIFLTSRWLVPRLLPWVVRIGNREHLTLFVILIILGTGWLSQSLGLSLAIGAFLAGMILSESEYQHQITLDILPVKDYFTSIFFISVGMLLEVPRLLASPGWFLLMSAGIILIKGLTGFIASWVTRHPLKVSMQVGLYLAQIGEFSLILAGLAEDAGLFPAGQFQDFLTVSLITMLVAPLLIGSAGRWSNRLGPLEAPPPEVLAADPSRPTGHVLIAGYGMIGRHLARVLNEIHIPFLVVDRDGEKLKQALTHQAQVLYGDSTHRATLMRANIMECRMLVVSLSDAKSSEQLVRLARQLNPELYILVRSSSEQQVEPLTQAGANLVIPEEFETSIEVFSRVLREFRIPNHVIEQQVELVRLEGYSMFRGLSLNAESLQKFSTYLTASLTESVQLEKSHWSTDRLVGELAINQHTGARLIAVVRRGEVTANPEKDFKLIDGDLLILFGRHAPLAKATKLVREGPGDPDENPKGEAS